VAAGAFLANQRNAVLVGEPEPARATWRSPSPVVASAPAPEPFYNAVDLVNRLEAETRGGRQGRIADWGAPLGPDSRRAGN